MRAIAKEPELREGAMSLSKTANPPRKLDQVRATKTSYAPQRETMGESHVVTSLIVRSSAASAAYLGSGISAAWAANAPGVTDTEIKIGQTMPYSGPASSIWRDRQDTCRLFQDDQRDGQREWP